MKVILNDSNDFQFKQNLPNVLNLDIRESDWRKTTIQFNPEHQKYCV